MVGINVNLDDATHQIIKNRAKQNLRSLKNEIIMILKQTAQNSNTEQFENISTRNIHSETTEENTTNCDELFKNSEVIDIEEL